MVSVENRIHNVEQLVDIFGRFPSFHDAEIVRLSLDRGRQGEDGPTLKIEIHLFAMTPEVDEQGKFILKNHVLADFRFDEISSLKLDDFNHQNVINNLSIEDSVRGGKFDVAFEGIYGADLRFQCSSIRIESVKPFLIDS